MADVPVTRYARTSSGGSVAYQVTGAGPIDLLVMHGDAVPTELLWEEPVCVRVRDRLGAFCRSIWLDVRGFGASDRDLDTDQMMDEKVADEQLAAVCEAVGCERVAVWACSIHGPLAIRYAALHPERVSALVLYGTFASYLRDDECPWGFSTEALARFTDRFGEVWGKGPIVDAAAPSRAGDDRFRDWMSKGQRLGLNPTSTGERIRARWGQDVRALLDIVRVPTLVIHRRDDAVIRVAAGRYLAERITGAKYVELPGEDHYFFVGDSDAIVDEIEEFLTGRRQAPEGDVVTTTVLFTDIVASTEQSARVGHRKWAATLDAHDVMVRDCLMRYRGREVKTLGDGFLATFDATTRAVRAAIETVTKAQNSGLRLRAGVHTGEVEVRADDVIGLGATIAKRICDLAAPGEVLVSETVKGQLVGSGITTSLQGTHTLKGVPDQWGLFAVTSQPRLAT